MSNDIVEIKMTKQQQRAIIYFLYTLRLEEVNLLKATIVEEKRNAFKTLIKTLTSLIDVMGGDILLLE